MHLQLGGVHPDLQAADMNVSAVALAAVDIAATALDSALLSVERTVERSQQRPEVGALYHQHVVACSLGSGFDRCQECVFALINASTLLNV